MKRRIVFLTVIGFVLIVGVGVPCGPWFPNAYLIRGNEYRVVAMPGGMFYRELLAIAGIAEVTGAGRYDSSDEWERTLATDIADLDAAFAEQGMTRAAAGRIVEGYESMRRAMVVRRSPVEPPFDMRGYGEVLDRIPAEFALYARAAALYHAGDREQARKLWESLLALPGKERRRRSTWTAYMIGRTLVGEKDDDAYRWFETVIRLKKEMWPDSLRLAATALGEMAAIDLRRDRPATAMKLYLEQFKEGEREDHGSGYGSLSACCRRVLLEGTIDPAAIAGDEVCRRIVTAWAISSCRDTEHLSAWLEVLTKRDDLTEDEIGRLAAVTYRRGDFDDAKAWTDRARKPSAIARWVKAKLLLREGDIDGAVGLLRDLIREMPPKASWNDTALGTLPVRDVYGDLATLRIGRREYEQALDAFLRAGHWQDAAYVAERVMTEREVEEYVIRHRHDAELSKPQKWVARVGEDGESWSIDRSTMEHLRWLLARRFARGGDWQKAMLYFPQSHEKMREGYVGYMKNLRESRREDLDARRRAEHLFEAAMLARQWGMEFFGTEDGPDWMFYDGHYEHRSTALHRQRDGEHREGISPSLTAMSRAGDDERERLRATAVVPEERFHYRRHAADLMWRCAELLPDNDPMTARALWTGGGWLKDRQPEAADRFYRALVTRCRKLPIGQEAERRRWFPKNFIE